MLVDDETHALESLRMLLEMLFPEKFEIVALCNSVDQAVAAIRKESPDLVFLDIQMPQKTGFTLLEILPQRDFEVIFTTAHQEHAIQAFKHAAFDYLLKPIDTVELQKTVVRYEEERKKQGFDEVLDSIQDQLKLHGILEFNSQDSKDYVSISEILYLKADGGYTEIHLEGGRKIYQSKSIGELEKRLKDSNMFFRVHHAILVNTTKLAKYDKKENLMTLRDGSEVSVSIRRAPYL